MNYKVFLIYLFVMAFSTYLVRVIPFILIRHKIENRFVKSFLYYVPYTVLTAMTFPAMFFATNHVLSAAAGFVAAIIVSSKTTSLIKVAAGTCLAVLVVELIYMMI